jgi:hypothetical protein
MSNPQRGDYTGRLAQQQRAEQAEELSQRKGQLGMVSADDTVAEHEGIWDPATNQRLQLDPQTEKELQAQYEEQRRRDAEEIELAEDPMLVEGPYVTMRVFQDIDQMTYGVGNTFDLKRGRRYRVVPGLYQHLASKGLAERC